jgi:hypothetical protein
VFIRNNNDLNAGFHELGIAPGVTYRLAFKAEDVVPDGRFHAVKVKVNGTGSQSVTALPGYFAPSKQALEVLRAKLEHEVTQTDALTEFPIDIALQNSQPEAGNNVLAVNTHVDIAPLRFAKQNDRQTQKLTLVTALLDAQAPAGSYTLREVVEEENDGKMACLSRAIEIRANAK